MGTIASNGLKAVKTIYFSHSKNLDYKKLYAVIRLSPLSKKHNFILPHELKNEPYEIKTLLDSNKVDLIVAEVSKPSTGQGIELGWANSRGIPIICLHKQRSKISNSLKLICSKLIAYTKDFESKLASALYE